MSNPALIARLFDWRPDPFAYIARRLDPPTSKQFVWQVAHGIVKNTRVETALRKAAKSRKYP